MKPAAQYLRMSREHQNYSLTYQSAHNETYAAEHGFEIVRTYTDAGLSGLTLKGRPALRELLADAIGGAAAYEAILVYDVSRWGRFQDPDQAAHYEFMCREAGHPVIYTAETFGEERSLAAGILKHLKRTMAAEFSRDLSAKIRRSKRGLRGLGFWTGGPPGYGLRRMSATLGRQPRQLMQAGEHKALRGYRTILVHGPEDEVATVRRIYREFLVEGRKMIAIVGRLNEEGISAEAGATWTVERLRQVLTNEKYAGALIAQKSVCRLGERASRPRREWSRVPDAVRPIVDRRTFDAVQAQFRRPKDRRASDEALIAELKQVLADHGELSSALIDRHPDAHCADVYKKRFGGLLSAYRLAGFRPTRRQTAAHEKALRHRPWTFRPSVQPIDPEEAWRRLEQHFAARGFVSCNTITDDPTLPSAEWYRRRFGSMAEIYRRLGHTPTETQRRYLGRTGK